MTCGFLQPNCSQTFIRANSATVKVRTGQVVLCLCIAFFRRFTPPSHGECSIDPCPATFGVHSSQIAASPNMPYGRGLPIETECFPLVLRNPSPVSIGQR